MFADPATETLPAPAASLSGRLLYVEDNARISELTALMLEDVGIDIVQASWAEEALRIIETVELPFDMVLTDIVMPGLSGVQFARRLQERFPDMPIVLTSGYSDDLVAGYGGQYELLNKPFTRRALIDCIGRNLIN